MKVNNIHAICKILRFCQSEDLGTYLRVHLFHKRVTKNTFNFIVGKVRWELDNWNAIMLSMAGRVTLARIVLFSIPNYFMQTVKIPHDICAEIRKTSLVS